MWECSNCGYKNSNSSLKCHGINCKAERRSAKEQPLSVLKKLEIKKVYDYCPKCHKDTFWTAARFKGKKAWRCTLCQKIAILIGKPKPFPTEVQEI